MNASTPIKEVSIRNEVLIWFFIATLIGLVLWFFFGFYDKGSINSFKELGIYLSFSYFVFGHILGAQFILHAGFEKALSKLKKVWSETLSWLVALGGFLLSMINLNWFGGWIVRLFFPEADFSLPSDWLTYGIISFAVIGLIGSFILSYFTMRLNIDESYRILYEQERLKKEMETARKMQMGLMPDKDPNIAGFHISGICLPAAETGGDCFDYFWLDDDKTLFGIAVADVSGKGLKAAMTAVMASGLIQRESSVHHSPAEILRSTNHTMVRKTEKTTFAAMLFATIDTRKKELTFANAGQMPPLMLRNGKVEELSIKGLRLPMGIKTDVKYEERSIPLKKGDLLLFYTDGVNETINAEKEMFEVDRIKQVLQKADQTAGTKEITDAIIRETVGFRKEHPQNDDLTMVAVRVRG